MRDRRVLWLLCGLLLLLLAFISGLWIQFFLLLLIALAVASVKLIPPLARRLAGLRWWKHLPSSPAQFPRKEAKFRAAFLLWPVLLLIVLLVGS